MNSETMEVREVSPGYGVMADKPAVPAGYKQTEVGMIPEDWDVLKLGSLAEIVRGKFSARPRNDPRFYEGNYPFLQTGDVTRSGSKISSFTQTLNEEGVKVSRLFPKGTLFFTIAANIGDVGISEFEAACPDSIVAISPNSIVDKVWLLYELASRKEDFEALASPGAQLNINLEKLRPYLLPVPPPDEQRAIATALSDVDALLEELDRLIAKKRDIKQATMHQLLTGQTRLPGFEGEWKVKRLEDIADVIDPHPSHRAPAAVANGIPFVGIGDLDELGNITGSKLRLVSPTVLDEHVQRYDLADELIGLGRVASIGKVVALRSQSDRYAISPTLGVIRGRKVKRAYLLFALKSRFVTEQFNKIMNGSTRSSVGMVVLRKLQVLIPDTTEEQTAIATVLNDMDTEIDALKQRRAKTAAIKQAMMQELLSGRIRLV
ncbi:MAG: restriction endonuclease subunit S [Halomonas sp.]|nr:restriction endonuclease subunit S [Halomonas sp.]MCD6437760.1 restriction endonuclease subunit S [Halomonas sp.]